MALSASFPVHSSPPLALLEAHLIEGSADMDLSGLALCRGSLLTISDRVENQIFSIESNDDGLTLREFLLFETPSHEYSRPWLRELNSFLRGLAGQSTTDWEGISCNQNTFFLVSEIFGSFLILQDGAQPLWRSIADEGIRDSYHIYKNAFIGFESISFVDEQNIFVSHERKPAAGLFYTFSQHSGRVTQFSPVTSFLGYEKPERVPDDITGSDKHDDVLYTLHRNSRQVCAQKVQPPFKHFLGCRGFAPTETSSAYTYSSMVYGRAEGLAATEDRLYIVLDNNGDELISNGASEALLFIFQNPW